MGTLAGEKDIPIDSTPIPYGRSRVGPEILYVFQLSSDVNIAGLRTTLWRKMDYFVFKFFYLLFFFLHPFTFLSLIFPLSNYAYSTSDLQNRL